MSKLTEIKISFQERNLEKFKNQVKNLPADGQLALENTPTYREWGFFLIDVHKNYEENKEYIAALRECPDKTMALNLELLDQKDAGVRVIRQLIQNLMDVESRMSGKCNPNEKYTMNMPSFELTGQERILLRDGGIAMARDFYADL